MKKFYSVTALIFTFIFCLSSCGPVGEKTASLSVIYAATTVLSFLTLIVYCCIMRKKDMWFLLMFSMVCVVNTGYLALSVSKTLEEALLANRISYLGSAFLPLAMLFIILDVCRYRYKKLLPIILGSVSTLMFFIAASPGYLDIYYKEVSLSFSAGVSVLEKTYGPWHKLYLVYLVSYFSAMILSIIYATAKKQVTSNRHAVVVATAVFVNLGVWFIEQLVRIDFEFLSVSYIICELFLLSLYFIIQDNKEPSAIAEKEPDTSDSEATPLRESVPADIPHDTVKNLSPQYEYFSRQVKTLTPTELAVFQLYLEGKSTKEVLHELNIKENTLKYHNKNIYSKLGVSSRKQLLELASRSNNT